MKKLVGALICIAVVLLSTTFEHCAAADGKNLLLIAAMVLSPLVLLIPGCRRPIPKIDIPLLIFIALITAFTLIFHPDSMRWSSIGFSAGFVCYFAMTARLVREAQWKPRQVMNLIGAIVCAYGAFLLLQQIVLLCTGTLLNNVYNYGWASFKQNSLAAEPSHSAFITGTMMFFYGIAARIEHPSGSLFACIRRNPWIWIAAAWVLLTTVVMSSVVMIVVLLLPWITRRNAVAASAVAAAIIAGIGISAVAGFNETRQLTRFAAALFTGDENTIAAADISGADRVIPAMKVAADLDPLTLDFWVGHGIDADLATVGESPFDKTNYIDMGFSSPINRPFPWLLHVWYDFGLIPFLCLLYPLFSICFIRRRPIFWLITAFGIIVAALNNRTPVWLLMTLTILCRTAAPAASDLSYPPTRRLNAASNSPES